MNERLEQIIKLAFAVSERAKEIQRMGITEDGEYVAMRLVEQSRQLNATCQEVENIVLGCPQPKLSP